MENLLWKIQDRVLVLIFPRARVLILLLDTLLRYHYNPLLENHLLNQIQEILITPSLNLIIYLSHPYIQIQEEIGRSSWYGFSVVIKDNTGVNRSDIIKKFAKYGVETRPISSGNFLKHDVIKYFDYRIDGEIETAEYIDKNGFFIGNHHYDVKQQITEISKLLQ